MNTFLKRSLTAIIFAVVMLTGLLWSYETFTLLFLLITIGSAWEYDRLIGRFRIYNRISAMGYRWISTLCSTLVYTSFYLTVLTHSLVWLSALPACLFIFFSVELFSLTDRSIQNIALNVFGVLYTAIPFGLLHLIVDLHQNDTAMWFPGQVNIILSLLLLIWVNDTFAYIGGSLIGRHKLFPAHSPKKSWEGFVIGMIGSMTAAFIINKWLLNEFDIQLPILLAFVAAVVGTTGDLFESMIKRNAGVKDSGSLMPGHGGFLDRFDAFLFTIPFVFILMLILNY